MMEYIDIESLNPAEYNPRLLTPEAQELLQQYAENAGMNAEQLLETYGEEEIYQSITLDRVCGLILEQVVLQPQNEQTAE